MRFFFIFLLYFSLSFAKYDILVITAYKKDSIYNKIKLIALKDVKKEFEKKFNNINIVFKYIDFKSAKKNYKDIKKLQKYITLNKNKILFIIAPGISDYFKELVNILPTNIPIITASSSIDVLKKYKGVVFSTSTHPKYYRVRHIIFLHNIFKYNKIINVYDEIEGSYPKTLIKILKSNYNIPIINLDMSKKNNFKFEKINNSLVFISAKDFYNTYKVLKKFNDYIKIKKIKNFIVYLPYFSYKYNYNFNFQIYFSKISDPNLKDFKDYDYLYKIFINNYNHKEYYYYDVYYKRYHSKILFVLSNIDIKQKNILYLRKKIYKIFKDKKFFPFIDKKTKYIYGIFQKENNNSNIYFNTFIKKGYIIPKLMMAYNNISFPYYYQFYKHNKNLRKKIVVYFEIFLKKIRIINLSANRAKVEFVIKLISKDKNFDIKKNLYFGNFDKDKLNINLLLTKKIKFLKKIFYMKVYSISGVVNIKNNLFLFPFDKQLIRIFFVLNGVNSNKYYLYLINNQNNQKNKVKIVNWKIIKIITTHSKQIIQDKNFFNKINSNSIAVYNKYYLNIFIKRINPYQIILKYFLPTLLLLLLLIIIYLKSNEYNIGIYLDILLGLISLYFVYSLLINFDSLIMMDIIFFIIFLINILFILIILKRKINGS